MILSLRRLVLLVTVPGALALPAPAEAGTYFTGSGSVAVYQLNIKQMERQWHGWAAAIKSEFNAPVPDVILGQDFETDGEVSDFRDHISTEFGTYYGYVATNVGTTNRRVVFWRTARFSLSSFDRWKGWGGPQTSPCEEFADNAQAIQVKLWDSYAGNYLSAVSMKTPPKGTSTDCAWKNMQLATSKLDRAEFRGALHFIGTDANAPDWNGSSYYCWWRGTVVEAGTNTNCGGIDLGWSDVIYDSCAAVRSCVSGHWTHSGNRIDFLFAKRGLSPTALNREQRTIVQYDCASFSDHCSVRAVVAYGTSF